MADEGASNSRLNQGPRSPGQRSNPFKSRMLALAIFVMVLGGGVWAYAAATAPEPKVVEHKAPVTGMAGLTGQAEGSTTKTIVEEEKRLVDHAGPAAFRLGLSFAIGYFLAWGIRTFAKMTLLVFGMVGVALILLTHFHVMGLNWALLQDKLEASLAFLQGQADKFKDFVMGYLPSTASGVAGTVFGFRRKG